MARGSRRGQLAHSEYPIEQSLRGRDDATRARLTELAWRSDAAPQGSKFVADPLGLRVLALSERALNQAVRKIAAPFGAHVIVRAPVIRYVPGNPVLEPYMMVLVGGPVRHLSLVQRDMVRRRGRLARASEQNGGFVLEAETPLAELIGYGGWVCEVMEQASPHLSARLTRYLPIDDGGPRAA